MKEFLKNKGIKVAIVLAAVILAIVASSLIWGGRTTVFSSVVGTVTSPVRSGLSRFVDFLEGIYGYIYEYDQLKAENEEMKAYIAKMEETVRAAWVSNEENDRFRELLALKNTRPELIFEPARVISRGASNWSSTFEINRGENAEIKLGDCVVTETGFLVGQVIEVGATTSVVRTVIDVESSTGALIDRNGISGVASGEFSLMGDGLIKLSYIPENVDLLNGDTVLTSGKGGIYPEGLVIGKIIFAEYDESGFMWYGIMPSADIDSLTQVFVVIDF